MLPNHSPAAAIPKHTTDETRGSSVRPKPRPKILGRSRSLESAWNTRGAQRKLPTALESVAAHTPTSMRLCQREHFCRIIVSVRSVAESGTIAFSATGTAI